MCAQTVEGNATDDMKRILIVEDEEAIRRLAVRFLQILGYDPIEAASPEDAIALMDKDSGEISAIITDIMMPTIDGRQLVAHVRQQNPSIKALYVSGYGAEDLGVANSLGPNEAFAQKPFTCNSLGESLSNLLMQ